jgi:hypothetical protein
LVQLLRDRSNFCAVMHSCRKFADS